MTEDGRRATGFSAKLIVDQLEALEYQNSRLYIGQEKHCFHYMEKEQLGRSAKLLLLCSLAERQQYGFRVNYHF